jgi:hypothetical protein
MLYSVQTGLPALAYIHGQDLYTDLSEHPAAVASFQQVPEFVDSFFTLCDRVPLGQYPMKGWIGRA